jgi:hypothetical protein
MSMDSNDAQFIALADVTSSDTSVPERTHFHIQQTRTFRPICVGSQNFPVQKYQGEAVPEWIFFAFRQV